ncbi:MAG: leucine-rich repeat protein [Kiritimatiellae bacterium]|nr:leucine-rich repeat protein [Kiritimatiellia bacterium]
MNAKKKNLRFRPVTILLMASAIALSAVSAFGENITVGDFSYSYSLSTKEGTMTSYKGSSSNVTIPSSFTVAETYKDDDGETHTRYHTITVTSIGSYVFASKTFITSVSFHNKLKSIGSYAFQGCTSISTISFPSSVTYIGASAVAGAG